MLLSVTFLLEVQPTKTYGESKSNYKVAEKSMTLIPKVTVECYQNKIHSILIPWYVVDVCF